MIENFWKYTQPNKNPSYINFIGRTKTKKAVLFVVDQIGETKPPLSYNKNKGYGVSKKIHPRRNIKW